MTATGADEVLVAKLAAVLPQLDERQRRLLLGAEAISLGRGGITAVAIAAGVSRPMVTRGVAEVRTGVTVAGRVRRPGGGRKSVTETDPGLLAALEALVDPVTRGDPMSPLRWTTKSTRHLADALTGDGHRVSHARVGELLRSLGYSLAGNAKAVEGKQHPDRDGQFTHINTTAKRYLKSGDPVISVDTKKKELVGGSPGYKNNGRDWQPQGEPVRVRQVPSEVDLLLHAARRSDLLELLAQPVGGGAGNGVALRTTDQQQLRSRMLHSQVGDRGDEQVERLLWVQEAEEHDQGRVNSRTQLVPHIDPGLGKITRRDPHVQADRYLARDRPMPWRADAKHVQML